MIDRRRIHPGFGRARAMQPYADRVATAPATAAIVAELTSRRRALGLSQREVEGRIACADGLLAKWEILIRRPTAEHIARWALALECRLAIIPDEIGPGSAGQQSK